MKYRYSPLALSALAMGAVALTTTEVSARLEDPGSASTGAPAMLTVELVILTGVVVVLGALVVLRRFGGRDEGPDPDSEFANWRPAVAEVISMLRAGNRTFLLVRFSVGTSLIQNDVQYPLPGAVPHVGQRVPIMYDPAAPARVVFDLQARSRTPVELG